MEKYEDLVNPDEFNARLEEEVVVNFDVFMNNLKEYMLDESFTHEDRERAASLYYALR